MKHLLYLLALLCSASFFMACEKEDANANKLHGDDGVWLIESVQYLEYDTLGNVLADSVKTTPGELIFFSTESLNALYGYYQGVYFDYALNAGSPMEYMIDGNRAHIQGMNPVDPLALSRLWTVDKGNGRRQVWSHVTMHSRAVFLIKNKVILTLREQNAF